MRLRSPSMAAAESLAPTAGAGQRGLQHRHTAVSSPAGVGVARGPGTSGVPWSGPPQDGK